MRETKKERVTVIETGSDKTVNKIGGSMGRKGGAETIDVLEVKVGRLGYVIDVGFKG